MHNQLISIGIISTIHIMNISYIRYQSIKLLLILNNYYLFTLTYKDNLLLLL